jgi:hypothetical protein
MHGRVSKTAQAVTDKHGRRPELHFYYERGWYDVCRGAHPLQCQLNFPTRVFARNSSVACKSGLTFHIIDATANTHIISKHTTKPALNPARLGVQWPLAVPHGDCAARHFTAGSLLLTVQHRRTAAAST